MNLRTLWMMVPMEDRRRAEEAYYLQYDAKDLEDFRVELQRRVAIKREIVRQWGDPNSRHSAATGIVLSTKDIDHYVHTYEPHEVWTRLYRELLFPHPRYAQYVRECAQYIEAPPSPANDAAALEALCIANRQLQSDALARACRDDCALAALSPPAEPRLMTEIHPLVMVYLSNSERVTLRLVCKQTCEHVTPHCRIQVHFEERSMWFTMTATLNRVRETLRVPTTAVLVRYGRTGPPLPDGRLIRNAPCALYVQAPQGGVKRPRIDDE